MASRRNQRAREAKGGRGEKELACTVQPSGVLRGQKEAGPVQQEFVRSPWNILGSGCSVQINDFSPELGNWTGNTR